MGLKTVQVIVAHLKRLLSGRVVCYTTPIESRTARGKRRQENCQERGTARYGYIRRYERCRGYNPSLGTTTNVRWEAAVTLPWLTIYGNVERDIRRISGAASRLTVIFHLLDCEVSLSAEYQVAQCAERRKKPCDEVVVPADVPWCAWHTWNGDMQHGGSESDVCGSSAGSLRRHQQSPRMWRSRDTEKILGKATFWPPLLVVADGHFPQSAPEVQD